jgi:cation diffusion facilitator CzcD-associated flavoprotein CzcO
MSTNTFEVIIIGAGFAGLGAAIKLKEMGIDDFVLIEKSNDVGGTWQQNTYPGCACDVPSALYSFSFALNPDWSRAFAPQQEIQDYLCRCTDAAGLRPKVRLNTEVRRAAWDGATSRWRVTLGDDQVLEARFLISAIGGLSRPAVPNLPGLENFQGKTFHSQRWDHGYSLEGKKVAVIGTGASAVQIVPAVAPIVSKLEVFQRSPTWIIPRGDKAISPARRALFRTMPPLMRLWRWLIYFLLEARAIGFLNPRFMGLGERIARRHLDAQVKDPALKEALSPKYRMGCKRAILSDEFYPALQRPNVELVTSGIARIDAHSIHTVDGKQHEVDCIVLATGFQATDPLGPVEVVGRNGVRLKELWADGIAAYKGTTVSGFPNLFFLVGPNTGIGHTSLVFMIEAQLGYVMDAIKSMRKLGVARAEVKPEVQARFNADIARRSEGTVWRSGGCTSWYLDSKGRNAAIWPGFTVGFWLATRRFDVREYTGFQEDEPREAAWSAQPR